MVTLAGLQCMSVRLRSMASCSSSSSLRLLQREYSSEKRLEAVDLDQDMLADAMVEPMWSYNDEFTV